MMRAHRNLAWRDIALCLVFFTKLPLPHFDFGNRKLAASIWAAPIAGLAVAALGALAYAISVRLGLAPGPASALALAATLLATGALHEDGLSDVADGFGGGCTRERKLEIMRDSRIGAYGAAALGLSLLIRWSALAEIEGAWHVLWVLAAAHAGSRGLLGAFMHALPPARGDGLSAGAGSVSRDTAILGAALGAAALLCLGLSAAIVAIVLLAALFFAFRALCLDQIGGQTGDTVGALQQLAEIAILLVASIVLT
jgi:adenosylcobinamide-GDP ribazoletransferase